MFSWNDFINDFPYTNFSDINVSWFLNKFKQIFDEWEGLYTTLQNWKTATDEYNENWREEQEQSFTTWETNFQNAIDEWKTQTETDINSWESDTLANLETWKTAFITQYNALKAEVEQIAEDAETAKNSAQASAQSAQSSANSASATAESLSASLTQIDRNTNDISDLKESLQNVLAPNIFEGYTPLPGYYDGTARASETYNYYKIPVTKGATYYIHPKMRMYVIENSEGVVVQSDLTDKQTTFTANYEGYAYITTYTADEAVSHEIIFEHIEESNNKFREINNSFRDILSKNIFSYYTPVTGKYYDDRERDGASYNYYIIPVIKGATYSFYPKIRMYTIKENDIIVQSNWTEKQTTFTSNYDGVAYITVYAQDNVEMYYMNDISKTNREVIETYDLTKLAKKHVIDKYIGINGAEGSSATYNYYAEIPLVEGNTYHLTGKGARFVVLYNGGNIVQTAENVSAFTANYSGLAYVTEYASDPISLYLYNDFHKLETWINKNVNGKVGTATSNTISFDTNEGDICYFKLNGYSGQYFTNCLLYAVQSGGNTIVASIYSDTGEYVFTAPNATTYIVYINKSQSETATIDFELTNLSKNTIFNSIERHNITNRFMPHIYGKKIVCLGDSFTYGVDTYVAKLNKRYMSHAKNYGVASSRIVLDTNSGGTTIQSFLNRYSAMDNDADIITIFGGINDAYDLGSGALVLGTIDSPLDTSTFYGGLKLLVTDIMKKYPDKQIIGIIPPDCQTGTYYITNLPLVQNAEREVYNMYGIPFIDIKRECYKMATLPEMVALYRAAVDNIHPSNAGQEALCDTIAAGIRQIIC